MRRWDALSGALRCRLAAHAASRRNRPPSRHGGARALPASSGWMRSSARTRSARSARSSSATSRRAARRSTSSCSSRPSYVETAKVFDMLLAVPKYGRVKVNKILQPVPHLAEQDDRRALAAPARRARLDAAPLSRSAAARGAGLRHHRPLRGRQGHADPRACASGSRARALRLGHHARAAPGGDARRRLPLPLRRRSSTRASQAGEFVEHAEYSGRRYGTLRSELERRTAGGRPGRARDRGPGRAAGPRRRCPRRCRSSSRRRRDEALRDAARRPRHRRPRAGRARGCASPRRELAAQDEFAPRGRQRPPRGRGRRAGGDRRARSGRSESRVDSVMISPRIDRLLDHVDSNYASVIVAAKRARQINSYYHNLGEGTFDEFPPPMVETALEELPDDRARGSRRGQDQVPLPLGPRRTGPRAMARLLLGVSGGIAAYKALELVRLATKAGPRRPRGPDADAPAVRRRAPRSPALTGAPVLTDEFERDPARGAFPDQAPPDHDPLSHLELVAQRRRLPDRAGVGQHDRQARRTGWPTTC